MQGHNFMPGFTQGKHGAEAVHASAHGNGDFHDARMPRFARPHKPPEPVFPEKTLQPVNMRGSLFPVKQPHQDALLWNSAEHNLDRRRSEPWSDALPRMAMRHPGGGTECERGVFRAERKRERVSAKPIERHQEVAEERVRGAEPCAARRPST